MCFKHNRRRWPELSVRPVTWPDLTEWDRVDPVFQAVLDSLNLQRDDREMCGDALGTLSLQDLLHKGYGRFKLDVSLIVRVMVVLVGRKLCLSDSTFH